MGKSKQKDYSIADYLIDDAIMTVDLEGLQTKNSDRKSVV